VLQTATKTMIGPGTPIRAVEAQIQYAAQSEARVLITGESGAGKEVVARLVHERSRRARTPLVTINCAGVPDSLLEPALFGDQQDGVTGALCDRLGLLEIADGATIFLDEIGDLSLRMQALLLRFVASGVLQRVGSDHAQPPVDVRVIAATSRQLVDRVAAKEFLEDLYDRLNAIHIAVPPLRARREDIPLFVDYFMSLYAERHGVRLPEMPPDVMARLAAYDWPGNVRELRTVVERLIDRSRSGRVVCEALPPEILDPIAARPLTPAKSGAGTLVDELFERLVNRRESFWNTVHPLFIARDMTRGDLRALLRKGLEQAGGSYKAVVQLFNMPPADYKPFLNFVRKHQCQVPFQRFRSSRVAAASLDT
jgi:transcriptional regulator with GAF, ATPase, and Fis domain